MSVSRTCFSSPSCSLSLSEVWKHLHGRNAPHFLEITIRKPSSPLFGTSSNRAIIRQHLCLASREPSTVESSKEVKSGEIVEQEVEEALPEHWKWSKTTGELVAYGLLLAAVPSVPTIPKAEWSGAFYFLFFAVRSVYVGNHRRKEASTEGVTEAGAHSSSVLLCITVRLLLSAPFLPRS
ncbi:unnamed protein product [Calypogeia fissa]